MPACYREKTKKSVKRNMDVVREKVKEWQQQRVVIRLTTPTWCTSPLSVAKKTDTQNGTIKKWMVLDLSRHVNRHVRKWNMQMEDLRTTKGMKEVGDWMAAFKFGKSIFSHYVVPGGLQVFRV
jgi:hypothetical protein